MAFNWTRDQRLHLSSSPPNPMPGSDPARRTQYAGLLVGCYDYLRQHGPSHPSLATAIAALTSAVAAYQAGNDGGTNDGIRRTLDAINAERRRNPSLPVP